MFIIIINVLHVTDVPNHAGLCRTLEDITSAL